MRFEQYARDFDLTVGDDDWSRIRRHFCEDAVREEHALPLISLRHHGIDQILSEWRPYRRTPYRSQCKNRATC